MPAAAHVSFQTKIERAAEMVGWLGAHLPSQTGSPWLVVDGFDAKREVLKPAQQAGFVVVTRLRKDAALCDRPPVLPPGQKRPRGRPPIDGKNRLSRAQRAGRKGGRQTIAVRTNTGEVVTKQVKTFLAPWRPAGGVVRVVIIKEEDGSWRAVLCTDPEANVATIVQIALDRWGIEQNVHDSKGVEGIEQVQRRRSRSNVGALDLNLWVPTLIEVRAWDRPAESLRDRSDRPWDDAERRPSHADRHKAVQRALLEAEYQQINVPAPWSEKIRRLLENVIRLAA